MIVTITGFAPDHIVAHMIHALNLDNLRDALPALDYRLLTVGLGVALIAVDVMVLNRKRQVAAPTAIMPEPETTDAFADRPSIAVLPFVNMSDDKSQEYFADGMTEDIITGLSYDSRLFVIARNSTAAYKGQTPDVRADSGRTGPPRNRDRTRLCTRLSHTRLFDQSVCSYGTEHG